MSVIFLPKKKVILDLDNCQSDTLEVFYALKDTLSEIAQDRDLPLELLYDLTREAEGEHRFNDAPGLIDYMNRIEPRFKTSNPEHKESDQRAKDKWLNETARRTVAYDGLIESLQAWHAIGTNVVMRTDAERLPVIRRIWLMAFNAAAQGELASPYEILPLYDHIYCSPSFNEPEREQLPAYLNKFGKDYRIPLDFVHEITSHMTIGKEVKPSPAFVEKIFSDFCVVPEEVLYVGDSYKDGLEAQCIDGRRIDFAWAKYGADWRDEVRDFYAQVGSRRWRYGIEEIRRQIEEHSVVIDCTLIGASPPTATGLLGWRRTTCRVARRS